MEPTSILLTALAFLPLQDGQQSSAQHPIQKDKTGLRWVLPFKSALARAKARNRLLMIKPVAFGTSPDGGW